MKYGKSNNWDYDKSNEYITPGYIINYLENKYVHCFNLDVASTDENHKCDKYFTREDDGLNSPWTGHIWCNPPYTGDKKPTTITRWIDYGINQLGHNANTITYILPATKTDQEWFHRCLRYASEIIFIKGRVNFIGGSRGATFPSMIVRLDDRSPCIISSVSVHEMKKYA